MSRTGKKAIAELKRRIHISKATLGPSPDHSILLRRDLIEALVQDAEDLDRAKEAVKRIDRTMAKAGIYGDIPEADQR